jgi:iron-sulfur cluster assembly protein
MITLTEAAANKVKKLIKPPNNGLQVGVQGGGCSGFTYKLEFSSSPGEKDRVLEDKGVTMYIDPKSFLYLMGTEIDYLETLSATGFKFVNPSAKRVCGCGESFSI